MADHTISYSEQAKGFPTFHSFHPDWIENLNDSFFTFKNGQLYIHHIFDDRRNEYYGQDYSSVLEFAANEGPSDVKMYRALKTEGDSDNWDVTVESEIEKGFIDKESFKKRENMFYAYIRNNNDDVDYKKLSVQGLGLCESATTSTVTVTDLNVGLLSVGDKIFSASVTDDEIGTPELLGNITEINGDVITHDGSTEPAEDDFILFAKNQTAESEGVRGYHAKIKLTNDSTDPVELYAVDSEVTKSNL
jgi:hypothetical protein